MHLFFLLAMLFAAPFWETREPRQWTDEELQELMTDSPWAQTTTFNQEHEVPVYIASAKPLREAEAESLRRYTSLQEKLRKQQVTDLGARSEYEAYLAENEGKVIVIGIRNPNLKALAEAEESKHMEEESRLKAGRKVYRLSGHFPPAGADPVLRLVFPRPDLSGVKDLHFELYIPGVTGPYREAVFRVKDLRFKGSIEM
jgi:hypothetical protein